MSGYMIAEVWCDICLERVVAEDEGDLRSFRAELRDRGWVRKRPTLPDEIEAAERECKGSRRLVDVCADCTENRP